MRILAFLVLLWTLGFFSPSAPNQNHRHSKDGTITSAWLISKHLQLAQVLSAYFVEVNGFSYIQHLERGGSLFTALKY